MNPYFCNYDKKHNKTIKGNFIKLLFSVGSVENKLIEKFGNCSCKAFHKILNNFDDSIINPQSHNISKKKKIMSQHYKLASTKLNSKFYPKLIEIQKLLMKSV